STSGGMLLGIFQVNAFHNVAHLLIGAALIIGGLVSTRAAKAVNGTVGGAYLLLGIVGLFLVGTPLNVLALNSADHVLHFASAVVLLGTALGTDKRTHTAIA
ncbi:MAG: DUF4383 domain-containing protein, partial [Salinibacterium sp.]|nr:DUF4383 domain-containing protein [Salinibacterium sp.]